MRTERTSGAQRAQHTWWIAGAALAHAVVVVGVATDARGDEVLQAVQAPRPREARGLAVVALPGGERAAWSLAQAVYASDALRPPGLDEAHARILAGEAPSSPIVDAGPAPSPAPAELRDLADTRAAIRGDDAPSRALLVSIADTFRVRGIVVVEMSASARPVARVFLADTGAFDAARYEADGDAASPDAGAPSASWTRTVASLARTSGVVPVSMPRSAAQLSAQAPLAPVAPPRSESPSAGKSGAFYTSPWFWGAVGAAAFGGAAVYFATRDNGDGTIHLQVQVPK